MQTLVSYEALIAVAVTSAFAGGAWLLRGVTRGGAAAGFGVALAIFITQGPGGFAALVAVFAIAWASTRLGHQRKQALGIGQDWRGRTAAQVLANLGAAAALGVAAAAAHRPVLLIGSMAALAEAAADTAASECGEALSRRAWLITTWQAVRAGSNGGVSVPGSLAAIAAAALVAGVGAVTHVVSWRAATMVALAGMLGTVVDSLLGATAERRSIIGNNGVNFLSTVAAAGMAVLLQQYLST
ncbi:MAG: DUF92 domain-containing protein [Terriglobales bacterium]